MCDFDENPRKSKTQVKREMLELRDLAQKIVDEKNVKLDKLPLSTDLREAIVAARTFKREALRRQVTHIGALMRDVDTEEIRQALSSMSHSKQEQTQEVKDVEKWRDALLNGDEALLSEFIEKFPGADRQHIRQIIRNVKKEEEKKKPPKSKRILFRHILDLSRREEKA